MRSGVFRRGIALLVDSVIYISILFLFVILPIIPKENSYFYLSVWFEYKPSYLTTEQLILYATYYGLGVILLLLYETIFLYSSLSATPGKIIMGIEVISIREKSYLKIFLRSVVKIFFSGIFMLITIIVMFFNKERRAIHDYAAGTQVCFREFKLDQKTPKKGLWILGALIIISCSIVCFKTNLKELSQIISYAEYSEVISIQADANKNYEGTWYNGPNWYISVEYKGDNLYIYDSKKFLNDFNIIENNQIVCKDAQGNVYTGELKDNRLILTNNQGNFRTQMTFIKKVEQK